MKYLTLVVPLAGLLLGCAQPPSARTSMGPSPIAAKQAPAAVGATGTTSPSTAGQTSSPQLGEFPGGPEERLKQNQVEIDDTIGDSAFRADQSKGAAGDRDAALRVAEIYRRGSNGVAPNERRMLQWLLQASALNNAAASYQLYLYFVQQRLDREAVYFENRAVSQGYTIPPRVDPKRS